MSVSRRKPFKSPVVQPGLSIKEADMNKIPTPFGAAATCVLAASAALGQTQTSAATETDTVPKETRRQAHA